MALRTSSVLFVMILVLFAAAGTQAGLTHLPSTGQEGSIYSGISSILGPRIEFAVFDTQSSQYAGINEMDVESQGRYVYVYEIFNTYFSEITYFNIYGIGEGAIDSDDSIGTLDDGDGVDAESYYFNSDYSKATWLFGEGTLVKGEDSVFLIVQSDSSWVAGTYDFKADDELAAPGPNDPDPTIPEPATLMILSVGGLLALKKAKP